MMHQYRAKALSLRGGINRNLAQKEYRQFPVVGCAARPLGEGINIHHAQVNRMVAENYALPRLCYDINTCHVVFDLFFGVQFEEIVEAGDAAGKPGAVMLFRIKMLNAKVAIFSDCHWGLVCMHNTLFIPLGSGQRARSWRRRCVKGGGKLRGILGCQNVPRARF